jgi:hypothetical protein
MQQLLSSIYSVLCIDTMLALLLCRVAASQVHGVPSASVGATCSSAAMHLMMGMLLRGFLLLGCQASGLHDECG